MNLREHMNENLDYESLYYNVVGRNPNSEIIREWRTKPITLIDYIEKLQNKNGIKILELGSGRGFLVKYLKEKGFNIIGSDFNKYNIKLANDMNDVELKHINALDIKINESTFDLVISIEVIEHIPDVVKHFKEVKKILTPSGVYCFTTPNIYIEKLYNFITGKRGDEYHISLQSSKSLKKLLSDEGYKVSFLKMNEFTLSQKGKLGKLSKIIPIRFFPIIFQPSIICVAKMNFVGKLA